MPYSEGIHEDMSAVIVWQHYWTGTNANESLRKYVAFEPSATPEHIGDVMRAVGQLERTWVGPGFRSYR